MQCKYMQVKVSLIKYSLLILCVTGNLYVNSVGKIISLSILNRRLQIVITVLFCFINRLGNTHRSI
jgi:hypothetical protein